MTETKPLRGEALCRWCGKLEADHEYTGRFLGLYCYLLDDCTIYKYEDTLTEAPRKRSRGCEVVHTACLASPRCTYRCSVLASHHDPVNHPKHYTGHPSGVECIQITEHMDFCLGNAIKYIWRAGLKDSSNQIEDLEKARWYLNREIERLKKG